MTEIPGVCPVCGAYSLAPEGERSALLAVCDVLVVKALEKAGNYLLRAERSRYRMRGSLPTHMLHTLWPAPDDIVSKALRGAWDVVPALLDSHGCCDITGLQVTNMLDEYVHDLVITGTPHHLDHLKYRFTSRLGLPVFEAKPHVHEVAVAGEHLGSRVMAEGFDRVVGA